MNLRLNSLSRFSLKYIILFFLIAYFIFVTIKFIKFPIHPNFELDPDEAKSGWMARSIGEKVENTTMLFFITLFGRNFPLMVEERHGALELYFLFPFLLRHNNSVESLRLATVFWGVIIIILSYYFVSNFFNTEVGILTSLLLVINSNFINLLRWGNVFGFTIPIFTLTTLIAFWRWHKTQKKLFFNLGMFILGLGANTKGWFVWFIIALFITSTLYRRYYKIKTRTFLVGFLFMLLGLSPIIYCNFKYNMLTLNFILHNLHITDFGINNFQFINNLLTRIGHLESFFNYDMYTGGHLHPFRNFPLWLFIFIVVCLFYLIVIRRKTLFSKRRISFILSIALLIFIFSTFTFTTFYPGHLYILFPYPQIIMAVAIYEITTLFKRMAFKILFFLIVTMLIIAECGNCLESYRIYKNIMEISKGGSIYDIATWISETKQNKILVWCYYSWPTYLFFLHYIHPSQIRIFYIDKRNDTKHFLQNISYYMEKPENTFIFGDEFGKAESSLEYKAFLHLVEKIDKQVIEEKRFVDCNGKIKFLVCSLKDR